jgi:hypothetical protein
LVDIVVSAKEGGGECPICKEPMRVQKSFTHKGRTIEHGTFQVRETVYVCPARCRNDHDTLMTRRSKSVIQALMPNSMDGYDLMVFVGRKRLLEHRQREEIRTQLKEKHGIGLSSGGVSNLTRRFLEYLLRLHHARADRLKAALEADGGWPMHVDATGEGGRGTLFVVMAGWRKWVLGAWKIATERADLMLPCLRDTVNRFGPPCGAMRDLGRAITPAVEKLVSELRSDIPILACHQHFLADIGKDLLGADHNALRELFRNTKVCPKTKSLVRELGRKIGHRIDDARLAVVQWQSNLDDYRLPPGRDGLAVVRNIAQWILDYKANLSGLDFPFDRPYLSFHKRCLIALRAIDAFLRIPPDDRKVAGAIRRLSRIVSKVSCEVPFRQTVKRLSRRADLFDELRGKLRMAKNLPQKESAEDLDAMRDQFEAWTTGLEDRRPKRGPGKDIRDAIDIILKHIETHGDNLWGHVITLPENAGGGIRLMSRTNELAENFFGTLKHGERRRSGRKNLAQDLEHLPAETTLAYNLERPDYVKIVCGSLDRLPLSFAQLDMENGNRKKRWNPSQESESLMQELQLSTASLSTSDRQVVRTAQMNERIKRAASSRAPRVLC